MIIVLDAETTGPKPRVDRIVELTLFVPGEMPEPGVTTRRFNPGIPIPPAATEVHGITDADVADCPPFAKVAKALAHRLTDVDLVGFGIARFDIPLLVAEFERAKIDWEPTGTIVDAMRIYHHFRPRNLAAAVHEYLHIDLEDAHTSGADALAAWEVFCAQREAHDLPEELAEIRALVDPDAVDWDGKFRRDSDGELYITFGKHEGVRLKNIADGYLEWMYGQKFGRSVKAIVREELLRRGVFQNQADYG